MARTRGPCSAEFREQTVELGPERRKDNGASSRPINRIRLTPGDEGSPPPYGTDDHANLLALFKPGWPAGS